VLLTALILAQNPENFKKEAVSLVGKFYPDLKISKSTDFLNVFSVDTSKNLKFKLYYTSSELSDAGVFLFPDQFQKFYDSRLLRFIERDLLLIYLNKGNAVAHENVQYKFNGKTVNPAAIHVQMEKGLLTKFGGLDLKSVTNGKLKFYTAVLTFDKNKLEITFPARVDLILGSGWEDLAADITLKLATLPAAVNDTAIKVSVIPQKSPVIEKRNAHRPGIFEDVFDTTFISGDCKIYYSKDSTGYIPVDPMIEPVEHLNNILVGAGAIGLDSAFVALKIKNYGAKFSELKVSLPGLVSGLAGGKNIFLAFEEYKGRKLVDLFFPDRDLNYFHLLYFEVDSFSAAALQNKTLKGWLYPYLRLDNLHDIDKEFDSQGKPKWRVPVGQ